MIKKLVILAVFVGFIFLSTAHNHIIKEVEVVEEILPSPAVSIAPTAEVIVTPEPTPTPEPEVFTISMVGDCTLASSQYFYDFEVIVGSDMSYPFSGTLEYFEGDYLSIANMECSLSDENFYSNELYHFLGATSHAEILSAGSIEFVTLANNHTMDFGYDGVMSTMSALDVYGIDYAEADSYFVYQRDDGIKIGLYAAEWLADEAEVLAGLALLTENEDVDLVISLMHWGAEGSYYANAEQVSLGTAMIDAGADIVYGSHPHVLQSIVSYGDGYIINSLANYVFGGNTNPDDKDTAIVQFDIVRDYDGSITIMPWTAIPCSVSSVSYRNDYCPTPYEVGTADYDRAMSKLLGTYDGANLSLSYRDEIMDAQ